MTNLSADFSRPDETPEPLGLEDILRMVAGLALDRRLGREWRRRALALTDAAAQLEGMSGLVIDGEVYGCRIHKEHADCKCGDNRHEFRRDAPEARGHWHYTRREAEATLKESTKHHAAWYPNRPTPHLVTHIVATTPTERVG